MQDTEIKSIKFFAQKQLLSLIELITYNILSQGTNIGRWIYYNILEGNRENQ